MVTLISQKTARAPYNQTKTQLRDQRKNVKQQVKHILKLSG